MSHGSHNRSDNGWAVSYTLPILSRPLPLSRGTHAEIPCQQPNHLPNYVRKAQKSIIIMGIGHPAPAAGPCQGGEIARCEPGTLS